MRALLRVETKDEEGRDSEQHFYRNVRPAFQFNCLDLYSLQEFHTCKKKINEYVYFAFKTLLKYLNYCDYNNSFDWLLLSTMTVKE